MMSFSPTGAAAIRIRRREFIGDLAAPDDPTAFSQTQYRLQPTDAKSFPWLSAVANHFTEWELHGAILTFETTSSNFAQNMALGTVAIATQYNASDMPYSSMRDILQAAYHSRGNPSECVMHGIECDPTLQASEHLFTRRFGTYGPANLYDHGVVTVATEGLPAAAGTVLGRFFITYDIELNLPALPAGEANVGRAATLWAATPSIVEPPMGDPLTLTPVTNVPNGLTYGTTAGSNIMALLPSNGPWARPNLPIANQGALVAWISNSSVTAGQQYVSFANEGTYMIELTIFGQSQDPGNFVSSLAITPDVEVAEYYKLFSANLLTYYRVVCTCTTPDQSISMTRQNATSVATFSVLSVSA
jgi:hypothetical protein